jgi:hypothetical protein
MATVSLQIKDQFGEEGKNNLKTLLTTWQSSGKVRKFIK